MLIGIDVGGTKIAIRSATVQGQTLAERRWTTDTTRLVPALIEHIGTLAAGEAVTAIGIGIPGMVDPVAGSVMLATNLDILQPLDLVGALSAEFNCPVAIENDVRLAASAVAQSYQSANLAYMSISTGVSAGLILNGELWRGVNGMAGEIGQIAVDDAGTLLEDKISGRAILRAAHAHGLDVRHASDLFALATTGDACAQTVTATVSDHVARALHWLVLSYDVEKIVLGGGVVQNSVTFLELLQTALARLRAASSLNATLLPDSKIEVLPSDCNAGLDGAIGLAKRTLTPALSLREREQETSSPPLAFGRGGGG